MFKVNKSKARKLFYKGETILIMPKYGNVNEDYVLRINNKISKLTFDEIVLDYKDNVGKEIVYYFDDNQFKQLCVWEGVSLGNSSPEEFEKMIKERLDCRVKFETILTTQPDLDDNEKPIPGTGGRNDILFYIHNDDIPKFSVKRLAYSMRWWEDIVGYGKQSYLYSKEILDKYPIRW